MKRFNAFLVLALSFIMPVNQALAQANPTGSTAPTPAQQQEIVHAVDLLNFKLTVLWDQKDPAFYSNSINEFASELQTLKSQNIAPEAILTTLKTQVLSSMAAADLDRLTSILSQGTVSADEASKLLADYATRAQHDGAHYEGEAAIAAGVLIAVVVGVIIAVVIVTWPHHGVSCLPGSHESCGLFGCSCVSN